LRLSPLGPKGWLCPIPSGPVAYNLTMFVLEYEVPDGAASVRIDSSCRLIKNDRSWSSNKRYGNRQLALHASWQTVDCDVTLLEQTEVIYHSTTDHKHSHSNTIHVQHICTLSCPLKLTMTRRNDTEVTSASEVTTLRCYRKLNIIIIINCLWQGMSKVAIDPVKYYDPPPTLA